MTNAPPASSPVYRPPGRPGTPIAQILAAADAIAREEKVAPTVRAVAKRAGASATTVGPVLKKIWWKSLGERLEAGPAALARLPESAVHILEALYLQVLEDARSRLRLETQATDQVLERRERQIEVHSHVLTLREGELENRVRDRDRTVRESEARLKEVLTLLAKETAARETLEKQLQGLQKELGTRRARALRQRLRRARHPVRRKTTSRAKAKHAVRRARKGSARRR